MSDIISGGSNNPIQFSLIKHPENVFRAIEIVQNDGLALGTLAGAEKNHKSVVIEAVQQDGDALQFASEALRRHLDIIAAAAR